MATLFLPPSFHHCYHAEPHSQVSTSHGHLRYPYDGHILGTMSIEKDPQ